jgi:hypothetical protein
MTTQQLVDLYNVLLDKYGSPSQNDSEIVGNLNMATYEWLNRVVPDNQGGVVNFEFDSNVVANIKPLIWSITENMDANGLLAEADIETALQTESSDATAKVFRIMSIGITDSSDVTRPVKYEFQNSLWMNARNFFKRPSATNPRYTLIADGLKFYPVNQTDDLVITVIKTPKALALTPSPVNPELPEYVQYNIVSLALKLGGIQVRDEELLQDTRLAALQISQ